MHVTISNLGNSIQFMNYNKPQRPSMEAFLKHSLGNIKDSHETSESILEMISLLKEYERQCQQSQDFQSAEEVKNKIEFLKSQEFLIRKERFEQEDKENMQHMSELGDKQIKQFEMRWEEHFQHVIETLKTSETGLMKQHEAELAEIEQKLNAQQPPRVKYSAQVLSMRNHLKNLIKIRQYKEAEHTKANLEKKQQEEQQKWLQSFETKKKHRLELVRKKQEAEVKALRVKLEAIFNEQMKERNREFQILLKKNRKRMIQTSKMSRARINSKAALLNESRAFSTASKF